MNTNLNNHVLPSQLLNDDYAIQPGTASVAGAANTQTIEHRLINGMVNPSTRRNRFNMMTTGHGLQFLNSEAQHKRLNDFQRQETGFDSSAYGNDTIRVHGTG